MASDYTGMVTEMWAVRTTEEREGIESNLI